MFSAITSFTVAANSTSFTDIGLLAGTSYYYRVKAVNGGGSSAYSDAASAITEAAVSPAAPSADGGCGRFVRDQLSWADLGQ